MHLVTFRRFVLLKYFFFFSLTHKNDIFFVVVDWIEFVVFSSVLLIFHTLFYVSSNLYILKE